MPLCSSLVRREAIRKEVPAHFRLAEPSSLQILLNVDDQFADSPRHLQVPVQSAVVVLPAVGSEGDAQALAASLPGSGATELGSNSG